MNASKISLACAFALFAASPTWAADQAAVVNDVRLSTLCGNCAVVKVTQVERRKGDASGMGAVGGAVAGGVVGNKTTDGGTLGTLGGAAVGGLLGNEIEKRVKRQKVWVTTVTQKDGSTRRFEAGADPGFKAGSVVEIDADNRLKRR